MLVAEALGADKVRVPKTGCPQPPAQNRQVSLRLIRPIGQMHLGTAWKPSFQVRKRWRVGFHSDPTGTLHQAFGGDP